MNRRRLARVRWCRFQDGRNILLQDIGNRPIAKAHGVRGAVAEAQRRLLIHPSVVPGRHFAERILMNSAHASRKVMPRASTAVAAPERKSVRSFPAKIISLALSAFARATLMAAVGSGRAGPNPTSRFLQPGGILKTKAPDLRRNNGEDEPVPVGMVARLHLALPMLRSSRSLSKCLPVRGARA